jgi:DMSO reductase family type II enzyme heme b subunit
MRTWLFALALVSLTSVAAAAEPAAPPALAMKKVAGKGPISDAAVFGGAAPSKIALLPQVITTPHNAAPATASLDVRAVRNADHAGFLLEWDDASADVRATVDRFGDMIAVEFPVAAAGPPPAPFMGNASGRVQILQWRADWQTDLDRGAPTVEELYPNAYAADFHHVDHLAKADAEVYGGAVSLGNPMSDRKRTSSVQDLMAEGFGSLTPRAMQSATGRARHDGKRWHVVITRPLAPTGDSAASLAAGTRTHVAFAVWNGSHGEVGARKAWANWTPMEVPK